MQSPDFPRLEPRPRYRYGDEGAYHPDRCDDGLALLQSHNLKIGLAD